MQMAVAGPSKKKSHVCGQRPPFERIALILQGGGALGSYQAGVYQALAEADLHPDWVSGISIGAVNAAIIAGNKPEDRVARLRDFWETITETPASVSVFDNIPIHGDMMRSFVNQTRAMGTILNGAPDFFQPRMPPPFALPKGSPGASSFYDTSPLLATLDRLVDFGRINAGTTRLSVGAVNVESGNFVYFDTPTHHIDARHIMASGALPPGFPAVEIDGESYWDGGIVSNTPLQWVLDSVPRHDTLAFQVDLWSATGDLPRDVTGVLVRAKDIQFSSRTRAATDLFKRLQKLRGAIRSLLEKLPDDLKETPEARALAAEGDHKLYNIVQLIYRAKNYEGTSKDFEFSRRTMEEHWSAGYHDAVRTLRHPEVLVPPQGGSGVRTFDIARDGRE